jgi:DHA2 family multidrug resistance protein
MISYTDPGNPLLQERLNGLTAFYQSNGYDANAAYDAAVNAVTGMVKLQSFFLGTNEIFFLGAVFSVALALVIFILWVFRNHQMLFNFFTFKKSADEKLPTEPGKI